MREYIGPVGTMCVNKWHAITLDDRHLRASGLLVFTDAGTALVWADSGAENLVLGLARGKWGSIVAMDGECED